MHSLLPNRYQGTKTVAFDKTAVYALDCSGLAISSRDLDGQGKRCGCWAIKQWLYMMGRKLNREQSASLQT